MKKEEIITKLNELEIKFDGLKDTMTVFQDNINNNISWFYASLGIFIALIGVVGIALYFLVQTAVNKGIEKGIEKTYKRTEDLIEDKKDFLHAYGRATVSVNDGNLLQGYGYKNLNKYNFINLTIVNRLGKVYEYESLNLKNDGFSVKLVDYHPVRDGIELYYNLMYMNNTTYYDYLKDSKYESLK